MSSVANNNNNEDRRPIITFVTGNKKKLEEVRAILESSKDGSSSIEEKGQSKHSTPSSI